ncbi:protease SohB [Kushneria aurantia]|uniref:Protease SohB n=1 Tax=Kushneria aurantia TaxID=504092 RepID=A0ABV6G4C5_9GAMM|nr:protease SohB [Kushneria aurantia]
MIEWFSDYALFLAQCMTVVAAVAAVAVIIAKSRNQHQQRGGRLQIRDRGEHFRRHREALEDASHAAGAQSKRIKARHKARKAQRKTESRQQEARRPVIWVLDFNGDLRASRLPAFTEEISAILLAAEEGDRVLLRLESGGGLVHAYGLAGAQLDRLRQAGLELTVSVDRVAASGGYMMACCADRLLAAPFAVIGSIGVVAQIPNLHRFLKKNDVDVEVMTAGRHKRTLTLLGENSEEGRRKFLEDLEQTHELFKSWVSERRPQLDIEAVSEGEIWYGQRALERALIDEVTTSDSWLQTCSEQWRILEVSLKPQRSLAERLGRGSSAALERGIDSAIERLARLRFEKQ